MFEDIFSNYTAHVYSNYWKSFLYKFYAMLSNTYGTVTAIIGAMMVFASKVGFQGREAFPPIMAKVSKAAAGVMAAKKEF